MSKLNVKIGKGIQITRSDIKSDLEERFGDLSDHDSNDFNFMYQVSGVELWHFDSVEDDFAEHLNHLLVDTVVEDGYMLGNISFEFVAFDSSNKTVTVEVFVAEMWDYFTEKELA